MRKILVFVFILLSCFMLFSQEQKINFIGTWRLIGLSEPADSNRIYTFDLDSAFIRSHAKYKIIRWKELDKCGAPEYDIEFVKMQRNKYFLFRSDSSFETSGATDSTYAKLYPQYSESYLKEFPLPGKNTWQYESSSQILKTILFIPGAEISTGTEVQYAVRKENEIVRIEGLYYSDALIFYLLKLP